MVAHTFHRDDATFAQVDFGDLSGSAPVPPSGSISNSQLANMAAWTIKGNVTGSSAAPTDFTIDGLTIKTTPASGDEVILWDVAGAAIKKATNSKLGAMALLNTLTASNSITLSDTTNLTSSYSSYKLVFANLILATNAQALELQVHSGGSFQATTYVTQLLFARGGSTVANSTATTFVPLGEAASQTNAAPGLCGEITIYNPSQTASPKLIQGQTFYGGTSGPEVGTIGGYWNGGNGAVDGFQVLSSSGNITSGTIKIYGIV